MQTVFERSTGLELASRSQSRLTGLLEALAAICDFSHIL